MTRNWGDDRRCWEAAERRARHRRRRARQRRSTRNYTLPRRAQREPVREFESGIDVSSVG
eukprot:248252-Pyramimonas_sp.AAC.1